MKTKRLPQMVCGCLFVIIMQTSSAPATSRPDLEQQVLALEETWQKGDSIQYWEQAKDICDKISASGDTVVKTKLGAMMIRSLLAKEINPTKTTGVLDLIIIQKGIGFLLNEANFESRRISSQLLCQCRAKIHKELIPNFAPRMVFQNVAPPPGVRGFAGMNPENIHDPVARAKYEAAIRENQQNNILNSRQASLESLSRTYDPLIEQYLIKTFVGRQDLTTELKECLKLGGFTPEEQAELIKKTR